MVVVGRGIVLPLLVSVSGLLASLVSAQEKDALPLPQRLRGANNPIESLEASDIRWLADNGANCLRINFSCDARKGKDKRAPVDAAEAAFPVDPLAPYQENIERLRAILPVCARYRIAVIVAASDIYGRRLDVFWKQADGQMYRCHLPQFWHDFAKEFRNSPAIVAYEILNEPNFPAGDEASWYEDMLPKSVAAIRSVDPSMWIVVEPGPWGMPSGFDTMQPLDDPRVLYSFHHYAPHTYTHQGVRAKPGEERPNLVYPGTLRMFDTSTEALWNKEALRAYMEPARAFQKRSGCRMFVGEFSAVRWAPGAARWLQDSVDLFEEMGWDWAYHSTAGWNGWNPTFAANARPSHEKDGGIKTDRLEVLLNGWALNDH